MYETDLDDMCRSWLLRIKNHLKSESVKCIKDEQSNCAMDRSSNKNPTPKINGKDNKKINAVGKFMGRIEKTDTKKWVSKDNVIKPTRHKEGKEKFIPREIQSDHVIYEFGILGVGSRGMMFFVERLLIHNNLGDRGKKKKKPPRTSKFPIWTRNREDILKKTCHAESKFLR